MCIIAAKSRRLATPLRRASKLFGLLGEMENTGDGPRSFVVRLTWAEVRAAVYGGVDRHVRALARGRQPRYDAALSAWDYDIVGAIGERAVSKALNLYHHDGSLDLDYDGDIGRYQVRARSRNDYDLVLHPNDLDDAVYLLVLLGGLPDADIAGWCYGRDGKQPAYWQTFTGRPCYFVPRGVLHPFDPANPPLSTITADRITP